MGLKSLQFAQTLVSTPYGEITVGGLSLEDITGLVSRYREDMEALFDSVVGGGAMPDMKSGVYGLLDRFPALAAEIIVAGTGEAGDRDAITIARRLPFPVQLELLEAVAKETFRTEEGLGKAVEAVIRVFQGTSRSLTPLVKGMLPPT